MAMCHYECHSGYTLMPSIASLYFLLCASKATICWWRGLLEPFCALTGSAGLAGQASTTMDCSKDLRKMLALYNFAEYPASKVICGRIGQICVHAALWYSFFTNRCCLLWLHDGQIRKAEGEISVWAHISPSSLTWKRDVVWFKHIWSFHSFGVILLSNSRKCCLTIIQVVCRYLFWEFLPSLSLS